jgi:hypothetical protein
MVAHPATSLRVPDINTKRAARIGWSLWTASMAIAAGLERGLWTALAIFPIVPMGDAYAN